MITLKTLSQATAQEVFDQVTRHLLTQNARSFNVNELGHINCVYRNKDGLKCAAGCLIGDDEYTPSFEYRGWVRLSINGLVPNEHNKLITSLQNVHDGIQPSEWPAALGKIAGEFGLEFHP